MSIEERVIQVVAEQLGIKENEVKFESRFVEDLGADSLDTVELIMSLEDEFSIEISDSEADNAKTVKEVVDYIENKLEKK